MCCAPIINALLELKKSARRFDASGGKQQHDAGGGWKERERDEVKPPRVCSCDVIVQRDGAGYRYYKFRARRAMRLLIIASFGKVSCPDQLCNLLVARRRYETL